ncbi:hypothetical protein T484DRAFT_1851154 [Baffinella frigidus]|nr:hypothetical protein T484DRAFT_1851154 [Cryptophyta sp. CCMP2293]
MRTFHAAAALALLALPAVSAFAPGAFAPSVRGFTAARSAVTLRAAPRVARSAIFSGAPRAWLGGPGRQRSEGDMQARRWLVAEVLGGGFGGADTGT